jgi:hypothetical protein
VQQAQPEIAKVFPFNKGEVQALRNYILGGGGRGRVIKGFERVLENPEWLMVQFSRDPAKIQFISEWLRKGGLEFVDRFRESIENVRAIFEARIQRRIERDQILAAVGDDIAKAKLKREIEEGERSIDRLILRTNRNLESNLLRRFAEGRDTSDSVNALRAMYPGFAVAIAVGAHSVQRAIDEQRARAMKTSDYGDMMHAFYAPYVDVYRTDAFMADAVSKALQAAGRRTVVARRLEDLPDLIESVRAAGY